MTSQSIDLAFAVIGTNPTPADHGYHLYAAISRALPAAHEPNGIGIHPIRDRLIGDRQMQLCDWSRLTIRVAAERIADFLPLAGKQLNLAVIRSVSVCPRFMPLLPPSPSAAGWSLSKSPATVTIPAHPTPTRSSPPPAANSTP